jgi:ribosomal protein S28E/S33
MNTFKHKSLYAALAGLGALGAPGVAQAVSVNPDGLGQALIYPYYTVRDKVNVGGTAGGVAPFTSLLSVVNSTQSAKAVKVRFLEGKNSREVLDFNLYLSKKDVWVAAIIPTATGAGIYTPDLSCTTPEVSGSAATPTAFVNYAYTGSAADGADTSLDRTREGYVEIIEMGDLTPGSNTEIAVTHVSGVPPCDDFASASTDTVTGSGGLFGNMTLINVLAGEDYGTEATALEGFSSIPLWFSPGSVDPQLALVNPKVSVVTTGTNTYVTDWPLGGPDPVSAVLMHNNVYNEFVLETATKSGTDWVVTMPTKRFYIATGSGNNAGRLFQRNFNGNSGSCDDVVVTQYDREERSVSTPGSFSPPPPTQTDAICWEANVITFNNTNVFKSTNLANITTGFQSGWASLNFPLIGTAGSPTAKHVLYGGASSAFDTATGLTTPYTSTTFNGLPVVGFAAITFNNGTIAGTTGPIQSSYGGAFNHRTTRSVSGL